MNKKHIVVTAILTAITVFMLSGMFFAKTFFGRMIYSELSGSTAVGEYSKFLQIETLLDERYMGEMDKGAMTENAYKAYVETLGDPYTGYLNKKSFGHMQENLSGDYVGIGVEIVASDGGILVVGVNPGSPAEAAGIAVGDRILAVNSQSVSEGAVSDVVELIRNAPEGEPMVITIARGEDISDVEVKREAIEIDYITSKMLDGNIGYVRIKTFGNEVSADFGAELEELSSNGMKGLIIDLRSNPGGVLEQVVKMTDMLVPEGIITTVREKDSMNDKEYKSDKNEITVPMCVLINSGSASASEVMAGALRDFRKATLIGEKTFGKGVVQGIYEFGDGTAMRVTVAKYYTPSGECIHGKGIAPDIEVSLPEGSYISEFNDDIQNDTQLQKALEVLGN